MYFPVTLVSIIVRLKAVRPTAEFAFVMKIVKRVEDEKNHSLCSLHPSTYEFRPEVNRRCGQRLGCATVPHTTRYVLQQLTLRTCKCSLIATSAYLHNKYIEMTVLFWVLTPCRLAGRCKRFGGTDCFLTAVRNIVSQTGPTGS
jgi:hypothetical protein